MALGRSNCRRTPPAVQYRTRRWFPPTIFFSTSLFSWGSTMVKSYEIPGVPTGISKIMALVFANCFCSRTWAPLAATTTRLLGLNMFKREGMSALVGRHRGTIYIYNIYRILICIFTNADLYYICCIYIDVWPKRMFVVPDVAFQLSLAEFRTHLQGYGPISRCHWERGSSCRDDNPN